MKWQIVQRGTSSQECFGVKNVAAALRQRTGYDPAVVPKEDPSAHAILIGGQEAGLDVPENGYRILVKEPEDGRQRVFILGADATNVLYGCMDFVSVYLAQAELAHRSCSPYYFKPLFADMDAEGVSPYAEEFLPAADIARAPRIRRRGLWTWGLAIYDYRGYLENMARLKMNEVIIWNDFAPVNGREVVEYAHSLGIRVIWGYAWGWDTTMRLDDSEENSEKIVAEYERDYAPLGGDGIYFQSFTETTAETLGGKLIAEAVTDFVNRTAARLLEKHPDLLIQFGLHCTSIRNHLEHIARTDPRVHILWSDCGDFPYHYMPEQQNDPEGTLAFTRRFLNLRPGTVSGSDFKGQICLNWNKFQHQTGPNLLGCADRQTIEARRPEAARIWHVIQAEWMVWGDVCRKMIAEWASHDCELYALVEDGLFEEAIPLPTALFAEMLWDCERPFSEVLMETAQRPDVHLY